MSDLDDALKQSIGDIPREIPETTQESVTLPNRRQFFHDIACGFVESKLVKVAEFGTQLFGLNPESSDRFLGGLKRTFTQIPAYEASLEKREHDPLITRRDLFRDIIVRHVNAAEKLLLGYVLAASTVPLIKLSGKNAGNAGSKQILNQMLQEPLESFLWSAVYAPIAEESLFRLLPHQLVKDAPGTQWKVGLPASIAFGAMHNWRSKKNSNGDIVEGNPVFDSTYIALPQMVLGATFWHIMRHEGIYFAMFAHALNNGMACFIVFQNAENPKNLKIH